MKSFDKIEETSFDAMTHLEASLDFLKACEKVAEDSEQVRNAIMDVRALVNRVAHRDFGKKKQKAQADPITNYNPL